MKVKCMVKQFFVIACVVLIAGAAAAQKKVNPAKKENSSCSSIFDFMNSVSFKPEATVEDGVRMMLYIRNDGNSSGSTDFNTVMKIAVEDNLLDDEIYKKGDLLTYGQLSYMIVKHLELKGSILNSIYPCGRYSYRVCVFHGMMPSNKSESSAISGVELVNIIKNVSKYKGE